MSISGLCVMVGILGICATHAIAAMQSGPGPYQCYQGYNTNAPPGKAFTTRGGGTVRINGFAIEVKPDLSPEFPAEPDCRATVRGPNGKIVFDSHDEGFDIDPITGKDINGDGRPDAVLSGWSGGAHCCSTFHIVSLGDKPGLIRDIENDVSFKDLKSDGRIEIVVTDNSFDYFYGDHVEAPFPQMILRLDGNKFIDISSDFKNLYDSDIAQFRSELARLDLDAFRRNDTSKPLADTHEIQHGLFSIVLDYLYSGRPKEARQTLDDLWPTEWPSPDFTRAIPAEEIWNAMLNIYCGEMADDLNRAATPVCKRSTSTTSH